MALAVLLAAAYTVQAFALSILWAAILGIATWPLYLRVLPRLRGPATAALVCTFLLGAVLLIPAAIALRYAAHEAPILAETLASANANGLAMPPVLGRIPLVGTAIAHWWMTTLGQPAWLSHLLSTGNGGQLVSAQRLLRIAGFDLLHALLHLGFTYLTLFFIYRDGEALVSGLRRGFTRLIGAPAWDRYASKMPEAIRATVNGLLLVGLGEGIVIGLAYVFAGLPSPVTWAAATGALGVVPFGAPLVFLAAALLLAFSGKTAAAIGVAAWGAVVLFVADHFLRPRIIGESTHQPFLAVLFGILGGVQQFGLIGLFLGPVLTGLGVTLWRQWSSAPAGSSATLLDE